MTPEVLQEESFSELRVHNILHRRKDLGVTPNEISYNAVINAHSQKGDPDGAKRCLEEMHTREHKCRVLHNTRARTHTHTRNG